MRAEPPRPLLSSQRSINGSECRKAKTAMDKFTREAVKKLTETLPAEERDQATSCLTTAKMCFNDVSKCISANGECGRKRFIRKARDSCRPIAESQHAAFTKFCRKQCEANVLGRKASTLNMQKTLDRGHSTSDSDELYLPPSLSTKEQRREWKSCVNDCRAAKAFESKEYSSCVDESILKDMGECAVERCAEKVSKCRIKRC